MRGGATYVRNLELVDLLQMICEYLNELPGWDVLHGVYFFVDQRKVLLQ